MEKVEILIDHDILKKGEVLKKYWSGTQYELWKRDGAGMCGWKDSYIQDLINKGKAKVA